MKFLIETIFVVKNRVGKETNKKTIRIIESDLIENTLNNIEVEFKKVNPDLEIDLKKSKFKMWNIYKNEEKKISKFLQTEIVNNYLKTTDYNLRIMKILKENRIIERI